MQLAGVFDTIAIERVVFGRPCPEALPEEADRIGAKRLFLIVSKTLDEETDQIDLNRGQIAARGHRATGNDDILVRRHDFRIEVAPLGIPPID